MASWRCAACTLKHEGTEKQGLLACTLCGTVRFQAHPIAGSLHSSISMASNKTPTNKETPVENSEATQCTTKSTKSRGWGFLKSPTARDVSGPNKRRKALDRPPQLMQHLVVLDFEWTADNKRAMLPIPEITQFPSVLVQLDGLFPGYDDSEYSYDPDHHGHGGGQYHTLNTMINSNTDISTNTRGASCEAGTVNYKAHLKTSSSYRPTDSYSANSNRMASTSRHPCPFMVDHFDTFVRPTFNPRYLFFRN
jgi:hypothetical protein